MSAAVITLTALAALLCIASCALDAGGRINAARKAFCAAWWVALLLLAANAVLAAAPPFGNMRHVLSFFPLVMAPAAVYLRRRRGHDLCGWLAAAAGIALIGALCMPLQAHWRQMPALQSPWFVPHVTAYVIAYGLMAVAAMLALASFRSKKEERLAAADAVVRLAFPFMTFGLASGAIWADAAWSSYWAWDIKEVWSLITWILYLLYFHSCGHTAFATWRRPLLLLGFAAVLITFLVVNFLPSLNSLHSYAG